MSDNHTIEDCPQGPMITNMSHAINRMERTSERTAIALEHIAAQGVMVQVHEKRLDKHDQDLSEVFRRIRPIEDRHSQDNVRDENATEDKKFWTDIKQRMLSPVMIGVFFFLWVIDKYDAAQWVTKMWSAMKGH